ncbi:hypothetical protein DsansV1_C26g0196241 [Dioscorea sansibarensis]
MVFNLFFPKLFSLSFFLGFFINLLLFVNIWICFIYLFIYLVGLIACFHCDIFFFFLYVCLFFKMIDYVLFAYVF